MKILFFSLKPNSKTDLLATSLNKKFKAQKEEGHRQLEEEEKRQPRRREEELRWAEGGRRRVNYFFI